jgi:hypothetical protein
VVQAEGYLEAAAPYGAMRHLRRILDLTITSEEFAMLETTAIMVVRMREMMAGLKRVGKRLAEVDAQLSTAMQMQEAYQAAIGWVTQSTALSQLELNAQQAQASLLLQRLPAIEASPSSKARLLLCRAHWRCEAILEHHDQVSAYALQVIGLLATNASLLISPVILEAAIAAYNVHSSELLRAGEHVAAFALVQGFQVELEITIGFVPREIDEKLHQLQMRSAMAALPLPEVRKLMQEKLTALCKPGGTPRQCHMLAVIAMKYLLEHGLAADASAWITLLASHRAEVKPHSRALLGFVLEVAAGIALEDEDRLVSSIRNMQYYARSRQCDEDYASLVAKTAKAIIAAGWDMEAGLQVLQQSTLPQSHHHYQSWFDLQHFIQGRNA